MRMRLPQTNRTLKKMIQASLVLGIATSSALADLEEEEHGHFDISPTVENGQIISNGYSDDDGDFIAGERVFGYEFGEGGIPGNETFSGDPGINVQPGAGWLGLPGLRVTGPLTKWNGSGYSPVSDPGVFITMEFGVPQVTITGTSGIQSDIFIGTTHDHYNSTIFDASGTPANGIYQFEAQIVSSDSSLAPSDTIWINFNLGELESVHEASLEYTETVLVPEPASALMLLAGAGLIASRRRRK